MDGNFLSKAFLVFCISCLPLWGTREEEELTDDLKSLEETILFPILGWNANTPAFLMPQIKRRIQNERDPLSPDGLKREGWEDVQRRLEEVKVKFRRSIEEVDILMRLIQVIQDAPRPEGMLDFDADDCHLLRALLGCEVDLLGLSRDDNNAE